ncbi:uncharacterized protein LOC134093673 [Sardina pilchardus]|uniref:uncharacterized protein LOC134093673 n=2 Tax=Sardina pilchardus TaxID=27697 RepID=UPI002E0DE528
MGLREGPICQTLKAQLRRDPALTFEAARKEALALEEDRAQEDDLPSCMVVQNSEAAAATTPTVDWKQELRAEIMKDVKEQMTQLSKVHGIQVPSRGVVVVRDDCLGSHRALLGMNVIASCWEELFPLKSPPSAGSRRTADAKEWEQVFTDCHRIQAATAQQETTDTARVSCRYAISVPANSEALVWAKLPSRTRCQNTCVLVEAHEERQGVEVARALTRVHRGRVPVRVRNLLPHPVLLHRHHKLAKVTGVDATQVVDGPEIHLSEVSPGVIEVSVVQLGTDLKDMGEGLPEHLSCESLQGDGLSTDQQRQLSQFLAKWQHVFSSHEEDYGCTDLVTHHIPTGEAPPIRERYRPVPPTLYKEIRTLLQAHLNHLDGVFQSLQKYGLKLRPEKCQLFQREVKFLGHRIGGKGVSPDPDKVAAVQDWQPPGTVRQPLPSTCEGLD